MTEEPQTTEPTPETRKRQAAEFEGFVVKVMRATSSRNLIEVRDQFPADALTLSGIINARLRILRGLD